MQMNEPCAHNLRTSQQAPPAEPLLVDKPWTLCCISRATWFRLEVSGKTPLAVKLGRRKLYRPRDLALWVQWGCPDREEFEARLAQEKRHF